MFKVEHHFEDGLDCFELFYENDSFSYGEVLIDAENNKIMLSVIREPKLYNHGLGTLMYEAALNHLEIIQTDYKEASSMAQRVWDSLIKKYQSYVDSQTGNLVVTKELL